MGLIEDAVGVLNDKLRADIREAQVRQIMVNPSAAAPSATE
jgi:hypothetical protein